MELTKQGFPNPNKFGMTRKGEAKVIEKDRADNAHEGIRKCAQDV